LRKYGEVEGKPDRGMRGKEKREDEGGHRAQHLNAITQGSSFLTR
jgi:hypothetical protein